MAGSLRSRKPIFKHSEDEYTLEAKSKKKSVVKSGIVPKKTSIQRDAADAIDGEVVKGSKTRSTKGNLYTGWKTVKAIETPVLRDRTNVPVERLKVDILMKQGIGEGVVKSAAKSSRRAIATAASKENNNEDDKKMNSVQGTRKKSMKKLTANGDTKSPSKNADTANVGTKDDEKPEKSSKSTRKTVKSAIFDKKHVENAKKTNSAETMRKTSKESRSKVELKVPESPKVESATKRTGVVKKSLRNTRKIVKSTESAENDEKNVRTMYSPKVTRKTSRKMEVERESSEDSTVDMKKSAKIDDSEDNATEKRSVAITRKLGKRATSKRISSTKKSEESLDPGKKSSQRPSRVKFDEKDAEIEANPSVKKKFFKSKATIEKAQRESPIKKTVIGKRRNIGTRRNARMSVSFRARQTTLDESFAKQASRKILRRRDAAKNYCEDTIIAKKDASMNDENDGVEKKTVPVYKSVKSQDNSVNDENEVYEFKFDNNDSQERLPKKKRRKVVRIQGGTKKKSKTVSLPKKPTSSKTRATPKNTETKVADEKFEKIVTVEQIATDFDVPTSSGQTINDESPKSKNAPTSLPIIEEENSKAVEKQATKPMIVDSVELKGKDRLNLVATPVLSKSSDLKPRNVLRASKQFGVMLSHALLNKSISPITKAIENFDPGSPWRPPTFTGQEFSRVKNIVQSTPQVRRFAAMLENSASDVRNDVARNPAESSKKETLTTEKNGKTEISNKRSPGKAIGAARSPRKFGTEISNVNNSSTNSTRIVESNKNNTTENVVAKRTTHTAPIEAIVSIRRGDTISHELTEPMNIDDENDDKENSLSSLQSPKKTPLKVHQRSPLKNFNKSPMKNLQKSPLRILVKSPFKNPKKVVTALASHKSSNKASNDENSNPQAGPSSSTIFEAQDDSRILRQSNLDNFLNIDQMPKSTRICTPHGIFDDPHSAPINGRKLEKKNEKNPSVDNAFGFDECDDSDNDITPVGRYGKNILAPTSPLADNQRNARGEKNIPATARLSIGDIKKHLLPMQKRAKVQKEPMIIERIEEEEKENRNEITERAVEASEKMSDPINPAAISDTQMEKSESIESTKEIPLFADLEEPLHFKQAPRYSYKRKRAVGFVLSEDEDNVETKETKKRKVSKVEKERAKQMENWAKDLNQTFEEIDHFDLVVE